MDITKTSLILIVVVVAMLTSALMVVPVSADNSINAMVDSCNCNCDCNAIYVQSSIPECCSISDEPFPDCVLSDVPDNQAVLPDRITLNLDVHNAQHVQSVSKEIDKDLKQLLKQESSQLLPACLCSEYHCRNSLNSDEPLLS